MPGVKGKSGRKQSTKEYPQYLIRLRPDLQPAVERTHRLLWQHGPKVTQTEAFWAIIEAGCAALERTLEGTETPAPAQTPIAKGIPALHELAKPLHLVDEGIPFDEDLAPAPASPTNGTHAPTPQPTTQPAIPLALEPAPKTAHPVDVPQAAETPQPRKTPMIPTGMQQCPLGHAPYPMSQSECPTCGRERQRSQRTGSQQPEGEVMPVPGYEVRPRHSVVTEDVPAPEVPAEPVPEKAQDDHTGVQESARQTAIPAYDASKYVLGKLCPRGHNYHGTGQSLRHRKRHVCLECDAEGARERRKAKRQEQPA